MKLINLIKGFIEGFGQAMEVYRYFKAIAPTKEDKVAEYTTDNKTHVTEYHKPELLAAAGIIFGASTNLGSFIVGNRYSLVTDDHFDTLSGIGKEFVLYHELGHINNGDIPSVTNYFKNLKVVRHALRDGQPTVVRTNGIELAADKYAADHIGADNAVAALKEILMVVPSEEILGRIEALGGSTADIELNDTVAYVG